MDPNKRKQLFQLASYLQKDDSFTFSWHEERFEYNWGIRKDAEGYNLLSIGFLAKMKEDVELLFDNSDKNVIPLKTIEKMISDHQNKMTESKIVKNKKIQKSSCPHVGPNKFSFSYWN